MEHDYARIAELQQKIAVLESELQTRPAKEIVYAREPVYAKERERLILALNGTDRFDAATADVAAVLKKHCIDHMPGVATDLFRYVLGEIHMDSFNQRMRNR